MSAFDGMTTVKAADLDSFRDRRGMVSAGRGVGIPFTIRGARLDEATGMVIVDVVTPVPELVELGFEPDADVHVETAPTAAARLGGRR